MSELDGMAGVNQGVADQKFPHCTDAMVWAEEYCKIFPSADQSTMLGWFANAIMAGYDTAGMRCSGEIQRLQAENAQLKAELEAYEAIPHDKDGTPFAAASAWRAECNWRQEQLEQATQRETRLREALSKAKCLANEIYESGMQTETHELDLTSAEFRETWQLAKIVIDALEEAGT